MTPGARVQAAIDCLERILEGEAAEKALTGWARGSRYAGSKDRAAVRTHVYDVLRQKRACALFGGGAGARALLIGLIRVQGGDPEMLFNGVGHAPDSLTAEECAAGTAPDTPILEVPDWVVPQLGAQFGTALADELAQLTRRAEVFLRVNPRKSDLNKAQSLLMTDAIVTEPVAMSPGALRVCEGARQINRSAAYLQGHVELQDAASQAAMETIPLRKGMKILDYCAGGGGKTLALAGRVAARFFAHDANPRRMRDMPTRATRAGVKVQLLQTAELGRQGPYDLVLADVPCSGSGTWRRDPDAKWRITPQRLTELNAIQDNILDRAAALVAPDGMLVYATCSLLTGENEDRIAAFQTRVPGWQMDLSQRWNLSDGADGFFVAHLIRKP